MEAVAVIKTELEPMFDVLLMYLESVQDMQAHQFFASIQNNLRALQQEEEVLELFIQLSMTAFQPFVLDPFAVRLTDDILVYAQQISETFSADSGTSH